MPVGYIPIILLLIIFLVDIIISLKIHRLVKLSDSSNILILGIATMVIFALKDLNSFAWNSVIACIFMSIVIFQNFYDEYQIKVKNKARNDKHENTIGK